MKIALGGLFEIVPAVKRLELTNVGCWPHLDLKFIPGLNIIKDDCCGSGKTTILQAITQAVSPTTQTERRLCPTRGSESGSIIVEFMSPAVHIGLDVFADAPESQGNLSHGQYALIWLRRYIHACSGSKGVALLVEDGILNTLDPHALHEAIDLLNQARCQIICVISHFREQMYGFPSARIHHCALGPDGRPGVTLQQSGEAEPG